MKTRRTFKCRLAFVFFILIICFSACKRSQLVCDLAQEQEFAQKIGDVFIYDYMIEQEDNWRGRGWSRLRKEGIRLAAYPSSRLRIIVENAIPLYLFCVCKPFLRDEVDAKSIRILLNEKELTTVQLEQGITQLLNINLPAEEIKRGNNWVEFFYNVDDGTNQKEPEISEGKRRFSMVVYDLILSSQPDFNFSKKYLQSWQSLKSGIEPGTFFQKVPSAMDFYLDIPEGSFLEARGTFYPLMFGLPSGDKLHLEVSIKNYGENEEVIHTSPLSGKKNKINLGSLLLETGGGVTRLRLKAGDVTNTGSLKGFLAWSAIQVIGQHKKAKVTVSPNVLSEYRDIFADKNIIFIIFDAARADHFSSYGYFRPTTPNADKFAQSSMIFTNAYSEALSTRCSIGTLFTGFPLTVTSLTKVTSSLSDEFTTLAQVFQAQGFKTTGYTGIGNIASVFQFDRGFDQYFELYKEEGFYRKSQQYLPYVLPWLEANKDNKFFLYIHFKEPHAIYKPLPPFLGMFSGSYKETVDLTKYHEMGQELSEKQVEYIRACYDENLASVDSVFGTIMDKLNDLDLDENTIVILTADHGDMLGENGRQFGHSDYFGEGVMHIPLFIRLPPQEGSEFPKKIDALVKLSDLFATLADGYGFDISWNLIGGKSLLPVISGAVHEVNKYVVVEKRDRTGFCIRTKHHKLIFWDNAQIEFYNLARDPLAENNIYQKENVMANYMLIELKKWIAAQRIIKTVVLGKDPSEKVIRYEQIDKEILENLKALGYIK